MVRKPLQIFQLRSRVIWSWRSAVSTVLCCICSDCVSKIFQPFCCTNHCKSQLADFEMYVTMLCKLMVISRVKRKLVDVRGKTYCDLKIASILTLKSNATQKKISHIQQSLTSVGLIPCLKLSMYPSALLDCVLR